MNKLMSWQSIENAPKDQQDILAARFDKSTQQWEYKVVYWTDDYGDKYHWLSYSNSGADDLLPADYFTHYMIPEPPHDPTR